MRDNSNYGENFRKAIYRDLETYGLTCPDLTLGEHKHKEFLRDLIGMAEGRCSKNDIDEHNKKVARWENDREQLSMQFKEIQSKLSSNHIV